MQQVCGYQRWAFAAAAWLLAGFALAQAPAEEDASGTSAGPGAVPLGPLVAYPGVEAKYGHNDNLYSSKINTGSSTTTILSPYVSLEAKTGGHTFTGLFRYDHGEFKNSHADDYNDYLLEGRADLVFSGRAGLGLHAARQYGHDPRGSTDRVGGPTPDEWVNQGVEGVFRYGAPGAQGRIEVNSGYFIREYQNNRTTTVNSDRNTTTLGGTFFWRVAPKTELLANAEHRKIDYDNISTTTQTSQSSTEDRLYAGAKWEATALTSGTVKFGQIKKNFVDPSRSSFSGSSWDAAVAWKPRTYSTVDLATSRQTNESTGLGDTIVTNIYGVTWTHAWNSRFRSQLLANKRHDNFFGGQPPATRIDDTKTYGLSLTYQFRRWVRFGAEYTRTERESNNSTFDYQRNLLLFSVNATL